MKIITPNYRNRLSPFRWLVREESEPLEAAVACQSVKATDVSFVDAVDEKGFGCNIVARAASAEMSGFEPEPTPIKFKGWGFENLGEEVTHTEKLDFNADGTLVAYDRPGVE